MNLKLWEVQMTCDHDLVVLAYTQEGAEEAALQINAPGAVHSHDVTASVLHVQETILDTPRIVAVVQAV